MRKKPQLKKEDKKNIVILDEGFNKDIIPEALCCRSAWFIPYR
jgi:hypothetical protein